MKSKLVSALKILLATALYLLAVLYGTAANRGLQDTQVVLKDHILVADAESIQQQEWEEEDPAGFCFWGESQEQLVICRETGGRAVVTQVHLAGNPGLMNAGCLAFQAGCLVDEQTAQDLFGTSQVGSQVLWHQDKPYPVLGIVEAPRRTMVLMAEPEARLDRLVLSFPPEQGNVAGPQCLLRWGLQGTVLDPAFLWSLIRNLLLVFPGILAALLCAFLAKGWRELTLDGILYGQLGLWGKVVLAAAAMLGVTLYLGSQVMAPKAMVPTQWSDFAFWERWWEAEKKNMVQLLFTPLGNGQLQILLNMVKSVVMNTAACLMLLWPTRRGMYEDSADRG